MFSPTSIRRAVGVLAVAIGLTGITAGPAFADSFAAWREASSGFNLGSASVLLSIEGTPETGVADGAVAFSGLINCGLGRARAQASFDTKLVFASPLVAPQQLAKAYIAPDASGAVINVDAWFDNPCDFGASEPYTLTVNMATPAVDTPARWGDTIIIRRLGTASGTFCWQTGGGTNPSTCTTLTGDPLASVKAAVKVPALSVQGESPVP